MNEGYGPSCGRHKNRERPRRWTESISENLEEKHPVPCEQDKMKKKSLSHCFVSLLLRHVIISSPEVQFQYKQSFVSRPYISKR